MQFDNLIISELNGIATVVINRPDKLNALNGKTLQELHEAFVYLKEVSEIKVVILTGSDEKAFVAGADIAEFANFNAAEATQLAKTGQELVFDYIENYTKPVIAAINGFALGGGLELALACHLRVASETAKMGLPETSLGLIPGYGGTQRLPQILGKTRALELILTAKMIDAQTALAYGLLNKVVPQTELIAACIQLAQQIMNNAPTAISAAIEAVNAHYKTGIDGYEIEIENFGKCFDTSDFKEGTQAFLEKRKVRF